MNWFDHGRERRKQEQEELELLRKIEHGIMRDEEKEISLLALILSVLKRIEKRLEGGGITPTGIAITQVNANKVSQGDQAMPITGIVKGAPGTFTETPTPAGTVFPAGTTFTWTSDDPLTTLTPSADGTSVAVATTASDPATSFNLTCTSSFTDPATGTVVAGKVNVPLMPAQVQTPTGIQIDQTS